MIGLFLLMVLGTLIYSIKSTNNKYEDYKLQLIRQSPYQCYAEITGKYTIGRQFEIEYQFGGKTYGEVLKVQRELFKKYREGDKILVTLSRQNPAFVSLKR